MIDHGQFDKSFRLSAIKNNGNPKYIDLFLFLLFKCWVEFIKKIQLKDPGQMTKLSFKISQRNFLTCKQIYDIFLFILNLG